MPGEGAKKRKNIKAAQEKQAAKKAAKKTEKAEKEYNEFVATMPKITEDDLLNFQIKHFGDDTRPAEWFIPKERALNFFEENVEIDDGLGYYPDGVKRTLTDEQIAMFRRREMWQMQRDREAAQEAEREAQEDAAEGARSPTSDASSLEDELLTWAAANVKRPEPQPQTAPEAATKSTAEATADVTADASPTNMPLPMPANPTEERRPSQQSRSDATDASESRKPRRSQQAVPYAERNKRKWESYIDHVDNVEGSMTHRRMARELDNQQDEKDITLRGYWQTEKLDKYLASKATEQPRLSKKGRVIIYEKEVDSPGGHGFSPYPHKI